ncbi:hypothetical protein PIB30_011162 [Stylosanthes scabra]|uniref:Ubiquitin-like domain-containing protein n=1 Tax=Stylosanthes scabra TaxID=79078 RepID=A0ABU6Q5Q8_9FABA|nr:hypothetical protein [Stylosanthes scabra]
MKFRTKRFYRSSSKVGKENTQQVKECKNNNNNNNSVGEIKWELRPGGMLVQKRECNKKSDDVGEGIITIRVSTVSQCHDISVEATSTFGELKVILSLMTSLEPREQRLLYRGKERDDNEFLHMVGVRDKDKVLLFEDPAIKEKKMKKLLGFNNNKNTCCTITA